MRRRTLLSASAAAVAAGFAPGLIGCSPPPTRQAEAFEPTNPAHVGLAYRKLGWTGDNKLTMHWINLTRYGLVDSKLTTLWDSVIGILFYTTDVADAPGDYDVTSASLSFYLDPKTGAVLDTFANPYTGETLDIPYGTGKPTTRRQNATGMAINMNAPPGMKAGASSSRRAWAQDGEVWVQGDLDIRMEAEGAPVNAAMGAGGSGTRGDMPTMTHLMQVNDWFTYHGQAAHVMDPANTNPPSDLYFNDLNTWSGWLKMEGHPGNFVGRGFGRKVFSYDAMPEQWCNLVAARYPDVAKDPEQWMRG